MVFIDDLQPLAPFRLDLTVWALRRRPENIIDRWDGETYRRVLLSDEGVSCELAVKQLGTPDKPRLQVSLYGDGADQFSQPQLTATLERLLGFKRPLDDFYRQAEQDSRLKALADQFRGFKPPRYLSNFEALVNAIVCQQLNLTMGIRLLNSLAENYGPALEKPEGVVHAFPRPQDLAKIDVEKLRELKFSYQKAHYLKGLAQALVQGELNLDKIDTLDDRACIDFLRTIKGVGPWTAEYVLLRALGRTQIFPTGDAGGYRHLQGWLGLADKLNQQSAQQALKAWEAYGGLVYLHLLLKGLAEKYRILD